MVFAFKHLRVGVLSGNGYLCVKRRPGAATDDARHPVRWLGSLVVVIVTGDERGGTIFLHQRQNVVTTLPDRLFWAELLEVPGLLFDWTSFDAGGPFPLTCDDLHRIPPASFRGWRGLQKLQDPRRVVQTFPENSSGVMIRGGEYPISVNSQ